MHRTGDVSRRRVLSGRQENIAKNTFCKCLKRSPRHSLLALCRILLYSVDPVRHTLDSGDQLLSWGQDRARQRGQALGAFRRQQEQVFSPHAAHSQLKADDCPWVDGNIIRRTFIG